ncbi:IS30 family transposase [Metallibacterium scheffleri]|nr:IS30 family transposase [Metallibacterium scheffleri]
MRTYNELSLDERVEMQRRLEAGDSLRAIARSLGRAASTISRERRRAPSGVTYLAQAAQGRARLCRRKPRVPRKLDDPALREVVHELLFARWSPQQIAGILARAFPDRADYRVSHETIYGAIYVTPRGDLRKQLIACLRQGRSTRKPRSRGQDRRGQIPNMQSIHVRPPEVEDRLVPGHWEGDLIKGTGNRSSVGTLVERSSGFVVLAKMSSATAADALVSFSQALQRIPAALRKTLTYDQGKEMSYHDALTLRTGVAVYFADPHSPWQRGSNENTNGLLRQYLPKGTDLSVYSQDELNQIALSLNTRPRQRHGFHTPLQVYNEHLRLAEATLGTMH